MKKRNWDRENMGKGRQDVRKMRREESVEAGKPPPQSKKEDDERHSCEAQQREEKKGLLTNCQKHRRGV